MSRYRFVPDSQQNDKKITVRLLSGEEITLGIEPQDTIRDLKYYIWKNKFGDLRAGWGRMKITKMTNMQDSNYVELEDNLNLYINSYKYSQHQIDRPNQLHDMFL